MKKMQKKLQKKAPADPKKNLISTNSRDECGCVRQHDLSVFLRSQVATHGDIPKDRVVDPVLLLLWTAPCVELVEGAFAKISAAEDLDEIDDECDDDNHS